MGLFVQNITLKLSDNKYLVEKVDLPSLDKGKIDLTVANGTVAIIGGSKYKGREVPYKLTRDIIGSKRAGAEAYLYPDKPFEDITVSFFGGQHVVSISSLPKAKAKFSIVGSATLEISDFKDLALYFDRSITKDELIEEINKTVRSHLSNEVSIAASRYITADTTDNNLRAALANVSDDVMKSRKTASILMNMGLILSAKGISMHLNALDDADDKIKAINDALLDNAIDSLNDAKRDREDREKAAARQHEIDMTKAQKTDFRDYTDTKNINTNTTGNGNVIINNPKDTDTARIGKVAYCPNCGQKIAQNAAKFCPNCGQKL